MTPRSMRGAQSGKHRSLYSGGNPPSGGGGGGTHPNEPAGFTQIAFQPMDVLEPTGWTVSHPGNPTIVSDQSPPVGSGNCMDMFFSTTMTGGTAPGNNRPDALFASRAPTQLYFDFYIKLSSNWQAPIQSGANKILYVQTQLGGGTNWGSIEFLSFGWDPTEQALQPAPVFENIPGVVGVGTALPVNMVDYNDQVNTPAQARGNWGRYEGHMTLNTPETSPGAGNGLFDGGYRWWWNGTLYGDYSGRVKWTDTAGAHYSVLYFEPTYGGSTIPPDRDQHMYMKNLYISGNA